MSVSVLHLMPQGRNGGYAPSSTALYNALTEQLPEANSYTDADASLEACQEGDDLVVVSAGNFDQKAKDMIEALRARAQEQKVNISFLWPASQVDEERNDLHFAKENDVTLVISEKLDEPSREGFAGQIVEVDAVAAVGPINGDDSYRTWKEIDPEKADEMLSEMAEAGYVIVVQPVSYVSSADKKSQVPVALEEIQAEARFIAGRAEGGVPVFIVAPDRDYSDKRVALDEGVSPATNPTTMQCKVLMDELKASGVKVAFLNKSSLYGDAVGPSISPWNVLDGAIEESGAQFLEVHLDGAAGTTAGVAEAEAHKARIPLEVYVLKASNNSPSLAKKVDKLYQRYGTMLDLATEELEVVSGGGQPRMITELTDSHHVAASAHIKRFGLAA